MANSCWSFVDDAAEKCIRGGSEYNVIDVQEKMRRVVAVAENEQGGVGLGRCESEAGDVRGEAMKPRAWRLLEPIEGFSQETHVVRVLGVDEAGRLGAVHRLMEIAIEEGVLYIKLVYRPVARCSEVENGPDRRWFHDWREGLIKVQTGPL